ncbi:sigma 54-interacting transcriptional regulator [Evansella clarkii]|uniref:sigma 54-interacting transcriptional regulator n=1 Tax=Evansella clarkii TaxID=79879 RepID=UPI000995F955|nr:sigma 54-interacting transcriptional regulator [Evansella clarkii]
MERGVLAIDWENIISSMHNGVVIVNGERKVLFMNHSAVQLLKAEGMETEGRDIRDFVPATRIPEVIDKGASTIGEEISLFGRQCIVNRTPFYEDGKRIGAISVIQDISEVKQYQKLLKQLEAIIEFTTDGIYVVDNKGITLFVNQAYEQITGFSRAELVGEHMQDLMENGYIDQSVSLLVLEKKEQVSIMQKINGRKDVIVTGNPVFNDDGTIELVVTSVRDITQLNELRKELMKAKTFSKINQHRYSFKLEDSEEVIVFESNIMNEIYEQVHQIAPYPTSVLLTGPSGSGKEVIANLIHNCSQRNKQPFIKVNCGAIPEQLLESELFGYVPGAFTGASREGKIGLLELADQGTVMLDEIGEMPLSLQVKLLRVLQEKQIYRIGSNKPIKLDIRIISATNQNLENQIKKGVFREDLYYRLKVIEIKIPPLFERKEDIGVLVEYFFQHYCQLYSIHKELSQDAKAFLLSYQWPGNVRELKNMVENLIVSVPSSVIEPYNLPFHITEGNNTGERNLKDRVDKFEKRLVMETLRQSPSIRKAAKELGINHSTLVKKLKRWNE